MTKEELNEIINQHELWIESNGFQGKNIFLIDYNLTGSDLSNRNLKDAYFGNCNLNQANFSNSKLDKAWFENCNLSQADFTGSNMSTTLFTNCIGKTIK